MKFDKKFFTSQLSKSRNEAKVILNRGLDFGEEGSLHARINIAMPKSLLQEVCQRIVATFAKC
ncbi:hypothetical protein AZJ20_07325 [Streptococcus pneumoniae]|nr:hypothetical protein AZJ20_07325 [Streptococcus pneumoniae]